MFENYSNNRGVNSLSKSFGLNSPKKTEPRHAYNSMTIA
jgi:hypothetical protein